MNDTYRLLITRIQEYKDYDSIIYGITEDGLVSLLAKGIRKPTSHKAYQLLLFSLVECQCSSRYANSFPIITNVNIIDSNRLLREDLAKQMIAAVSSELVSNVPDNGYSILNDLFKGLNENKEPLTCFNQYLSRILLYSGIQFHVDDCIVCQDKHINSISINEGGFVCVECQKRLHSQIYPVDFLKKFRYIVKATKVDLARIYNLDLNDFQLTKLLLDSIEFHLGIKLKTKEFFIDSYIEFSS